MSNLVNNLVNNLVKNSANSSSNTKVNRTIQDIYPLSPTQQGLLFHSLYGDSETGAYGVQVGYTLKGDLDIAAFEQSWQQLAHRHSILRTAFVWEKLTSPIQAVGQQVIVPIHWQDWQLLSIDAQTQKLADFLMADRAQGFNLSHAPLMRINAFQFGPNHYRIVWSYHHILLDGWSLPLLFSDWIAYYQAALKQSLPAQLGVAYPYRDYIAWLQQQDLSAAKQFWRERLAGISAPTPLGIGDVGNSEDAQGRQFFKEQHYQLSVELSDRLKAFAQQHRLTLSSLVQGAWAKVLSVYSGEHEVLYGLACAGRPASLPEANQRVGLFINTLPMRVNMAADSPLIPWLQTIQAQQLAQQPYEYTPLTEIQAVSSIPRQSPLFESVVVFENYPLESTKGIAGLDLLDVAVIEQTHYPLTLFAVATEAISFKAMYDAQRFSEGAIARLSNHLQTTLTAITTHPQSNLGDISILSVNEQQQLLDYGQGPSVQLPELCMHEVIAQQSNLNPDATAIVFEGEKISYRQLNTRANQLAHYLKQQISSNAPIGLCVDRSIEMVVSLLAILKAGRAYVPLDPSYPASRLLHAVNDAGIEWIVCHEATVHILEIENQQIQLISLNQAAGAIATQPSTEIALAASSRRDIAYLIYTSGSTGKPKGVPITHESLNNLLSAIATRLSVKPTDTLMAVTTLAFDIAALELFLPLISGACLLLASSDTARNPHQLIAYLDTYGVDIMQATPATWRLLISSGWAGQNGLKILCGGEALDTALAKQLLNCGEEVWNMYGPTETTIWSGALSLSKELLADGRTPIGAPIDNTQFYVLNERKQPVPVGVAGELYIGGLGLSQGYWNRDDLTAERFADGLYKTGDRVRYREDGTLDYLGRLDYQTKLRGYRIE
ncbi:MAG: amino acid adenylation domain-containing protein, partial [Phormidesmis sp.]